LDVVQTAHLVAGLIAEQHPAKVFIDVGGVGAGVYDILVADGFATTVTPVNFGERAENPERFVNRRAEMWKRLQEWLNSPLPVKLPQTDGLVEDLTAPLMMFDSVGRLQLEAKADIKKRLGHSTDLGDALALTFAMKHTEFLLNSAVMKATDFIDDNVYL
jgi:hypothetical protein